MDCTVYFPQADYDVYCLKVGEPSHAKPFYPKHVYFYYFQFFFYFLLEPCEII